jgi:hypothetical protein
MLISLLIHANIIFFVNQTILYTKMGNKLFQRMYFKNKPASGISGSGF